jgi:hypothetical protein
LIDDPPPPSPSIGHSPRGSDAGIPRPEHYGLTQDEIDAFREAEAARILDAVRSTPRWLTWLGIWDEKNHSLFTTLLMGAVLLVLGVAAILLLFFTVVLFWWAYLGAFVAYAVWLTVRQSPNEKAYRRYVTALAAYHRRRTGATRRSEPKGFYHDFGGGDDNG